MHIVLVGAGQMGRSALAILAQEDETLRFTVLDRDEGNLAKTHDLAERIVATRLVDILTDELPLAGADLVLNFAGPFFNGSDRVARAAIASRVAYIDVGDDVECTQAILSLDAQARSAGVSVLTGGGLSPGVSNWLACQIVTAHPQCDQIKVAWVTHESDPGGLAPLRHMLHMAVTPCPVWRDGQLVNSPGFVPSTAEAFDFPEPFGRIEAFDTAHPEPLTLGLHFPQLREVSCKGSLRPDWANAAFSTLGRIGFGHGGEKVSYGELEIEPAEFLWRLMWQRYNQRPASRRHATTAVLVQGLLQGRPVETRTIIDDGDMSRGTGMGMASAALVLLRHGAKPGAAGVEALPAEEGVATFLRLAQPRGYFRSGVIVTSGEGA